MWGKMIARRRKPRKGDRFALMRAEGVGTLPNLDKPRRGKKFADPEDVLQEEVNETLSRMGQFHFRIPASVYRRANDKSIAGWPDNPMITKLQPGLAILGPLELKREGETLHESQLEKQALMGTFEADNWPLAWAYIQWFRSAVDHVRQLLAKEPLPPLPAKPAEGGKESPRNTHVTTPEERKEV